MTKSQKLKKIIKVAVERGWEKRTADRVVVEVEKLLGVKEVGLKPQIVEHIYFVLPKRKGGARVEVDLENLIFSHDFAKAVFGGDDEINPPWKWQLQKAVISKDPIDYYWKFITK